MAETDTNRFELAQVNLGRLVAPLDDPRLADFKAALDPVNALADAAPGSSGASRPRRATPPLSRRSPGTPATAPG
jgi:hypothetical protein